MGTTIKVPLGITRLLTVSPVVVVTGSRRGMTSSSSDYIEESIYYSPHGKEEILTILTTLGAEL